MGKIKQSLIYILSFLVLIGAITVPVSAAGVYSYKSYTGTLITPSDIGLKVDLYTANDDSKLQSVVDDRNSAACIDMGSYTILSDHSYQGFDSMMRFKKNVTKIYISNGTYADTYSLAWIGEGYNEKKYLADTNKRDIKTKVNALSGDLVMYTCAFPSTYEIHIAIFKKTGRIKTSSIPSPTSGYGHKPYNANEVVSYRTMKKGDFGYDVYMLRERLASLNLITGGLSNKYTTEVESAIQKVQKAYSIAQSGKADEKLLATLKKINKWDPRPFSRVTLSPRTLTYTGRPIKITSGAKVQGSKGKVHYQYYYNKSLTRGTWAITDAGTYYLRATVDADANYRGGISNTVKLIVKKAPNPIQVKPKTLYIEQGKAVSLNTAKAFSISKAKGKVDYTKQSGNSKITVSRAGVINIKKGLKQGAYKIKIKVRALGDKNHMAGSKTVTLTIVVR